MKYVVQLSKHDCFKCLGQEYVNDLNEGMHQKLLDMLEERKAESDLHGMNVCLHSLR